MAKPTPQQLQAMLEQYLGSQGDSYPTLPSIDPYIQDQQGDFFTTSKQGATLAADPSFLMTNGLLDNGAFDPISSYEPVETPGASELARWRNGNDYQKFVAAQIDSGTATPNSIVSQLAQMAAQPKNDTEKNIIGWLPPGFHFDQVTGAQSQQGTDFQAVGDEIRKLYSTIQSDPQNTVIDPSTGLPSTVTTEDSPMTIKARSLGYRNTPGEPYSGYDFAPEGVTPESDASLGQAAFGSKIPYAAAQGIEGHSQNQYEGLQKQTDEAQRKWLEQEATRRKAATAPRPSTVAALPGTTISSGAHAIPQPQVRSQSTPLIPENPMTATPFDQYSSNPTDQSWGLPGATQGGSTFSMATDPTSSPFYDVSWDQPGEKHDPNRPGFPGADAMGRPNAMPGRPQNHGSGDIASALAQSLVREVLAKKADQARFALSKDQRRTNAARRQMVSAVIANDRAKEAARQRQGVANQLTSQGRTKFGDEVQMRMAAIYGMGR